MFGIFEKKELGELTQKDLSQQESVSPQDQEKQEERVNRDFEYGPDALIRAKFLKDMEREGSVPLGTRPLHDNDYIRNDREKERINELLESEIRSLRQEYADVLDKEAETQDPKERGLYAERKVVLIREMNNRRIHLLLDSLNNYSSSEDIAKSIHSDALARIVIEKDRLERIQHPDQTSRTVQLVDMRTVTEFIDTRKAELEKMLVDLDIRWKEKQIWDLNVETSPEKEALQMEVDDIKKNRLQAAIKHLVEALSQEKEVLVKRGDVLGTSERLQYVVGRLAEYQGVTGGVSEKSSGVESEERLAA